MLSFSRIWIFLIFLSVYSVSTVEAHEPHDDVYEVEISPEYSKDRTVYVIVRRDLFKSVDGGESWTRLWYGLDQKGYLESLAIAPSNKNVLYVSALGGGVFRTADAGMSWERVDRGIEDLDIDEMIVAPYSADAVLCGARSGGVYLTRDGGKSWRQIMPGDIRAASLGFFPKDRKSFLVGARRGVLYRTRDGGNSWEKVFSRDYAGDITAIAISPNFDRNNKFYFGTEGGGFFYTGHFFTENGKEYVYKERDSMVAKHIKDIQIIPGGSGQESLFLSTWHDGVYFSPNNGWYWFDRSKGLTRDPQADHPQDLEMLGRQAGGEYTRPHFHDIRISDGFVKDKTLFVGGFKGLFKSTDGGKTWNELETYSRSVVGISISPDYYNDAAVAVATYADGVYLTKDGGVTWQSLSGKLKYVRDKTLYFRKGTNREHYLELLWPRFYDIKFSPDFARDDTIYIMPLHLTEKVYVLKGEDLKAVSFPARDSGGAMAFSPRFKDDGVLYVASQKGSIYGSDNRGNSLELIGKVPIEWGHNSVSFCISPGFSDDRTMFFSAPTVEGGAFKSEDAGRTWRSLTGGTLLKGLSNIHLAVSPGYGDDKTVAAGTAEGAYISSDGGESWKRLNVTGDDGKVYVEALSISPAYVSDGTFLIYVRGAGLYKTTDRGVSFRRIEDNAISFTRANIPSGSPPIQFSPHFQEDGTIYGYGAAGGNIFKSTDRGESWDLISIPEREETFTEKARDIATWIKAWIPVLKWRTKVFLSKTQLYEEALLAAGVLFVLYLFVMALRGMFKG